MAAILRSLPALRLGLSQSGTIHGLKVFEVTVDAAVAFEKLLTHAPDFIQNRIGHVCLRLRIVCPKRACGIDSGETNNGTCSARLRQIASNCACAIGFARCA